MIGACTLGGNPQSEIQQHKSDIIRAGIICGVSSRLYSCGYFTQCRPDRYRGYDGTPTIVSIGTKRRVLYIALILNEYEKEVNKDTNISYTKDFKYPPILPVIFYDGEGEWTAETNFLHRTEMSEIFEKYIPKFEYELVSLKEYSFTDLADFGALLLRRINVPQAEIEALVKRIDERGISEMIAIEDYDVQETRREAGAEAKAEAEQQLKAMMKAIIDKGGTIAEIAGIMNITEGEVMALLPKPALA